MKEVVYVKAVVLGKDIFGQRLVQLVAQNTDGIKPFWTDRKDLICFEDIFETTEKKPLFLQKVFGVKKCRQMQEIQGFEGYRNDAI